MQKSDIRISIQELSDMVQMSDHDKGMEDLLSKLKTYYLLKRSKAPLTTGYARALDPGVTYTNSTVDAIMIMANLHSTVAQNVDVQVNGVTIMSQFLPFNTAYSITFQVPKFGYYTVTATVSEDNLQIVSWAST